MPLSFSSLKLVVPGGNQIDGREDKTSDTILEYDITGDSYKEIGHMLDKRFSHAVSVVQYSDFSPWCKQFNIKENNFLGFTTADSHSANHFLQRRFNESIRLGGLLGQGLGLGLGPGLDNTDTDF